MSSSSTSSQTSLACDAAQATSGWQRINPPGDLGDSQAIALDPFQAGVIYTQMHKGGNGAHSSTDGIYKSMDCGTTWAVLPPGRNASDKPDAQGKINNIHAGSIVGIILDPGEPGVMYIASNYGPSGIYKSVNGGIDWDQLIPADLQQYLPYGGWFNALSIDPTDRLHLIGATHTGCDGMYAPNCIAETWDGGKTWRLIAAPAYGNEQSGVYILDAHTMMYASPQNGVSLSIVDLPNSFPTWHKIGQGASGADTGLSAAQADDGKYYIASDYGVLSGDKDDPNSWSADQPGRFRFIVRAGNKLVASVADAGSFYIASTTSPNTWTELKAGGTPPGLAGRWLVYDEVHHMLYSSNWGTGSSDGLFRLKLE